MRKIFYTLNQKQIKYAKQQSINVINAQLIDNWFIFLNTLLIA